VLPSEDFDLMGDDIDAFLKAYLALWIRIGPLPQWGLASMLDAVDDPSTIALIEATSGAAGGAHTAVHRAGIFQSFGGSPFDPVGDWRNSFVPGHPNAAPLVINHCEQIIGHYRQLSRDARARERGIVGIVARFVRFPSSVRDAAGLTSKAGQRGAFAVGVAVQVVGTLISVGLLALVTDLIAHVLP